MTTTTSPKTITEILRFGPDKADLHRFSHAAAAKISGLSSDSLLIYHRRMLLPRDFSTKPPGRGHLRSYTLEQVVILKIAKILIMAGASVPDAFALASVKDWTAPEGMEGLSCCLSLQVMSLLLNGVDLSPADWFNHVKMMPCPLIGIFRLADHVSVEGWGIAQQGPYGVIELYGHEKLDDMTDWMRRLGLISFSVVDLVKVAVDIVTVASRLSK
jgi:hypothetical protein